MRRHGDAHAAGAAGVGRAQPRVRRVVVRHPALARALLHRSKPGRRSVHLLHHRGRPTHAVLARGRVAGLGEGAAGCAVHALTLKTCHRREMVAGCRAWALMTHAQVIHEVIVERTTLVWPADPPAAYVALGQRCLARDPSARPTFEDIGAELARIAQLA